MIVNCSGNSVFITTEDAMIRLTRGEAEVLAHRLLDAVKWESSTVTEVSVHPGNLLRSSDGWE
jgi:hypothetical protein